MTAIQTEVESQAIALATEAFHAFCEDISGMFDVTMKCTPQEAGVETVKGLEKRLTKLLAVNFVEAKGALNGTFQLIFDQAGLFTTSGVIVMLPERRILEEIKRGTIKDIESMNDAIKETGNLLVGAWDRVFRKELQGHGHFKQTTVFVGKPWENPEETMGLAVDEEYVFVPFEMTIDPYPPFKCGVIFPKTIFADVSEPTDDQETEEVETVAEHSDSPDADAAEEKAQAPSATENQTNPDQTPRKTPPFSTGDAASADILSARTEEIMDRDVVWGSPEDSVQQALTKMQDHNVGYLMVGEDGVLDGIVSNSNIAGAVSPYLRPAFVKWRRPLDDATLNIRVKWIMTRPVHTVRGDAPLAVVIEDMCQFGTRCLVVVNEQGKVQGVVTAFGILSVLSGNPDVSHMGRPAQAPPMLV